MTWKPIKKNAIGEGVPCVKISSATRGPRSKYSQIVLHISATLARHIQVRSGDRIELEIGNLADAGWMRISKGNEQRARSHGHEGAVQVRFSGRRLGVEKAHRREFAKYKTGRNSRPYLIFMLPKWARTEGGVDGAQ